MKPSLFITGAGGFLGNRFLAKLDASKYRAVYCLDRQRESIRLPEPEPDNVHVIEGDLLESASYETALNDSDIVIHMAAVTGKAAPEEYTRINTYATLLLLDRCKDAGVKRFIFISSIAVAFKNKYRYFYAFSKEQAENYVKSSGLPYTILRPTMLMGKGSPVFAGLSQLAGLPVIPVFGDGKTEIQPIHVDDMARAIRQVVDTDRHTNQTLEVGGPQTLTVETFLKQTARHKGDKDPPVMHLPMGPIVFALSILERFVYGLLPLTVGQLASFRNHGTAEPNSLTTKMSAMMIPMDKIIAEGLETEAPPKAPEPVVKECRVLTRYLVNREPGNYIIEKYYQCHEKINLAPADKHDAILLKLAGKRPFFTRMTDAYSRFFRPRSVVRKKLSYLMAILEVTPPYFRYYDSADGSGFIGFVIKAGLKAAGLAFHLLISVPFLLPLQIIFKKGPAPTPPEASHE